MFNVECCKLQTAMLQSLKFFREMLLHRHPGGFVFFFEADCQKRGLNFSLGNVTSIKTGYDDLTLKLRQEKRWYPDEGWFFIGRMKVGSVPGMTVTLEGSKKSIMSIMQGH